MSDDTLGKSREQKKNIFLKVVLVLRGIQRESERAKERKRVWV
jgi:hypothetical protein